jgi:hypothetical protein
VAILIYSLSVSNSDDIYAPCINERWSLLINCL